MKASIFCDPKKSRELWHDLLKYTTIFRYYVDMVHEGEFGGVPSNLEEPIMTLGAVATRGALFTRNISLLSKLELGSIKIQKEAIDIFIFLQESLARMQPLLAEKKLSSRLSHSTVFSLEVDRRHVAFLLDNMLYLIIALTTEEGEVEVKFTKMKRGIILEGKTLISEVTELDLKKMGEEDSLWSEKGQPNDLTLAAYILKTMSKKCGASFDLKKQKNKIIISYMS